MAVKALKRDVDAERLAHRAPAQKRGQATLDRIVAATERLLRSKPFEEITIAEIVSEAETSTGSFYARFASKDALLPYLYESYNVSAEAAWNNISERAAISGKSLREVVGSFLGVVRSGPIPFDNFFRVMALYSRAHPERLPATAITRSKRYYDLLVGLFTPFMRGRARDTAQRARFAAYATMTLMREHQLFGGAPLAAALDMSTESFAAEVEAMIAAYLAANDKK